MKIDQIAKRIAAENELKKGEVAKIVAALFEAIKTSVEGGEKVTVPGLGSFVLAERGARTLVGEDGAEQQVETLRYVSFKPARDASGKPKKNKNKAAAEA